VIGHAHVNKNSNPNTGQSVVMSWKGPDGELNEAWKVKLEVNSTYISAQGQNPMIKQEGEEFLGLYVEGVTQRKVGLEALVDRRQRHKKK
jgi:hypothetical protein